MRVVEFDDGFTTETPPTTGTFATVTGTLAEPQAITAEGGVTPAAVNEEIQYIAGDGGAVQVTADPPVAAGTFDGQKLVLIGTSDDDTVSLAVGASLKMNGDVVLGQFGAIELRWSTSASLWVEVSRNGMPAF